jgi:hypothetical protein
MLSFHLLSNRTIIIIGLILVLLSFLDNTLMTTFWYSEQDRSSSSVFAYFNVLFSVNMGLQVLLLASIFRRSSENKQIQSGHFKLLNFIMLSAIIIIIGTFFSLVIQIIENKSYDLSTFVLLITFDLIISSGIVVLLIVKFLYWARRRRNLFILLYLMAFSAILLTLISALFALLEELAYRPSPVSARPNPFDAFSTRKPFSYDIYKNSSLISFGLIWLATSIMLWNYGRNYSGKIGKGKFWTLACLPLVYYVFSFQFVLSFLNPIIFEYPYLNYLLGYLFAGVEQIGGFFFALAFIFMAKNVDSGSLKYYLTLSAVGIMILFSSVQITALHFTPFPPFGLSTLSLMPISCYLVLIGLYHSARSISYDKEFLVKLQQHIKNQPDSFLNAIGSSEWTSNLEVTVNNIMRNVGEKEEDLNTELSTEEIRRYVSEVMKELKK